MHYTVSHNLVCEMTKSQLTTAAKDEQSPVSSLVAHQSIPLEKSAPLLSDENSLPL